MGVGAGQDCLRSFGFLINDANGNGNAAYACRVINARQMNEQAKQTSKQTNRQTHGRTDRQMMLLVADLG